MSNSKIVYTIMTDYGGAYGWIVRDGNDMLLGSNFACSRGWGGEYPISAELEADLANWQSDYNSTGWLKDRGRASFDWRRFHVQGIELTRRLKIEMGDRVRVIYEKVFEDPCHYIEERREVLNDGSLLPLPNRAPASLPSLRDALTMVISGGQTGVDRAALDCAIKYQVPHGGWCPQGRIAEDGTLDVRYALRETESKGYRQRTRQNVIDSDGTLILNIGELSDGSLTTMRFADQFERPYLVFQLEDAALLGAVDCVLAWLRGNHIKVLNVAGPRASKRPGIYQVAVSFLDRLAGVLADERIERLNP